ERCPSRIAVRTAELALRFLVGCLRARPPFARSPSGRAPCTPGATAVIGIHGSCPFRLCEAPVHPWLAPRSAFVPGSETTWVDHAQTCMAAEPTAGVRPARRHRRRVIGAPAIGAPDGLRGGKTSMGAS